MSDRNVDKQFIQAARGTPHSIDAEVAVLGALLLHSRLYEQIAQVLQPRDFFRGAHQVIYAAMVRLLDRPDGAVELVTLADELKKRGVLDSIGGKAYLASLVDGLPRSTNIVHYAEVVREKALYRSLMEAGLAIHQQAQDEEEPPSVLLAQADARLLALQRSGQGAMVDISAATSWLLEDLQHRVAHQGELTGVPTGFPTLDALTQGWQPGDVIVIAARPSMGKTAFVVNSIIEACRMGKQGRSSAWRCAGRRSNTASCRGCRACRCRNCYAGWSARLTSSSVSAKPPASWSSATSTLTTRPVGRWETFGASAAG